MEHYDIMIWRKKHSMTQTSLAIKLGVARNTVVRWEAGKTRLPVNLLAQLRSLEDTSGPKAPEQVTPSTASHWPEFDLYLPGTHRGLHIRGKEHPCTLLGIASPAPAGVMTDPTYLAAVDKVRNVKPAPQETAAGTKYEGVQPGDTLSSFIDREFADWDKK